MTGTAFVFSLSVSMFVIPSLLIGDRFQTLATLIGRSFLLMRNEQLGSTTAAVLLVLAVSIVVGSGMACAPPREQRMTRLERGAAWAVWGVAAAAVVFLLTAARRHGRCLVRLLVGLHPAAARLVAALV